MTVMKVPFPGDIRLELGGLGLDGDGDVAECRVAQSPPGGFLVVGGAARGVLIHAREAVHPELTSVACSVVEVVESDNARGADREDTDLAGEARVSVVPWCASQCGA